MENYLNEQAIRESTARARRGVWVFRALAVLILLVLVILCLLTKTGNARTMLLISWICLIPLGWAAIACRLLYTEPARAEEKHLAGLAEGTPETREGRITVTGDVFRIPKSVLVRKVRLETDGETLSLNLNEKLTGRMPPDGSLVRVMTVRKFITAMEVKEAAGEQAPRKAVSRAKAFGRALARVFPLAFLWTMLVPVFTGFVFNRITDTDPTHKIVLYADCEVVNAAELAEKLEEGMEGAVRMVKVHPFSYALFGSEQLKTADLYIVPDSRKGEYAEWFTAEEGVPVCDPESGRVTAGEYFLYNPAGAEPETYRLYYGAASVHLEDGLAWKAADLLLSAGKETEGNK